MADAVYSKPKPKKLPTLDSTLTVAFDHLSGGWRSYINFVKIASDDGDTEMMTLLTHYKSLALSKRNRMTPESLCLSAGINIKSLLRSIMPWIWIYSNTAGAVITAVANPSVIAKTAKSALGQSKNAHKDRETFLKMSGALPTARGGQTVINNMPVASAVSGSPTSGLPIHLPSARHDIMELEASDADNDAELDNDNDDGT